MIKNLIIFFMLLTGAVFGQSTSLYQTVQSTGFGIPLTNKVAMVKPKAENCLDDVQQTFTAAAGFETITNFTTITAIHVTATHSNLTTDIAGWWHIPLTVSYSANANSFTVDGHFFTNGVEVSRIGWSRGFGTAAGGQQGSAAGSGLIYIPAGVDCQVRIDTTKDTTLDFDHLSFMMLYQNP